MTSFAVPEAEKDAPELSDVPGEVRSGLDVAGLTAGDVQCHRCVRPRHRQTLVDRGVERDARVGVGEAAAEGEVGHRVGGIGLKGDGKLRVVQGHRADGETGHGGGGDQARVGQQAQRTVDVDVHAGHIAVEHECGTGFDRRS